MAEYIEREALLSELQEEIDFETSMYTEEQNKYFNMGLKCAVRDVKSQPTADVVPKSEEGAECPTCYGTGRIGTTNWLTQNMTKKQIAEEKAQAIAEHEQYIKTEYAREIFEEIGRKSIYCFPSMLYTITRKDWDELEKKYTEGRYEQRENN